MTYRKAFCRKTEHMIQPTKIHLNLNIFAFDIITGYFMCLFV